MAYSVISQLSFYPRSGWACRGVIALLEGLGFAEGIFPILAYRAALVDGLCHNGGSERAALTANTGAGAAGLSDASSH